MRVPTVLAAALLAISVTARGAESQDPSPKFLAAFASDSVAWERILVYVIGSLSTHLVRTADDPTPQPWRITLPPDEPQRTLLETRLRTLLRARPVLSEDTVVYELRIDPLTVTADTARTVVRTSFRQRCAGSNRTQGYENVDQVYIVRHPPGFWGVALTAGVMHGDSLGCPRPPR